MPESMAYGTCSEGMSCLLEKKEDDHVSSIHRLRCEKEVLRPCLPKPKEKAYKMAEAMHQIAIRKIVLRCREFDGR